MKYGIKNKILAGFVLAIYCTTTSLSFAAAASETQEATDILNLKQYSATQLKNTLNFQGFFTLYFSIVGENLPKSYQYIGLKFKNVAKDTPLYGALQKGVYLNYIQNKSISLPLKTSVTEDTLARAITENFDLKYDYETGSVLTLQEFLETMQDLRAYLANEETAKGQPEFAVASASNFYILNDAFLKLKYEYLSGSTLKDEDLIAGAIE